MGRWGRATYRVEVLRDACERVFLYGVQNILFKNLVTDLFADYSRPLVVPFVVAVPNVNYPPGMDLSVNVFYHHDPPITYNHHIYRYIAIISFEGGRTT